MFGRRKEKDWMKKRTDLALETREQFVKDNVEVEGVEIKKKKIADGTAVVTCMKIKDKKAQKIMEHPMGTYITVELVKEECLMEPIYDSFAASIAELLKSLGKITEKQSVLVVGLGNREVTPDSLGPLVADRLLVTRHLEKEMGSDFLKEQKLGRLSAIAPGVMGQTGMEIVEILHGVIKETKPDLLIIVDALAARSTERVNRTIQITDTGICPGAGIGNHRQALNEQSLGVKVIAVGVPTVVDAFTIVADGLENVMRRNHKTKECRNLLKEIYNDEWKEFFVTPKNIDETVKQMASTIADAINRSVAGCSVG